MPTARRPTREGYQLKPDDIDVLLFVVRCRCRGQRVRQGHEYLDKAKKLHPDEVRLYQAAAALEMQQQVAANRRLEAKHYDNAMAEIEEGIKKVSGAKAMELLFFKAELQIPASDVKGARQTIEELQKIAQPAAGSHRLLRRPHPAGRRQVVRSERGAQQAAPEDGGFRPRTAHGSRFQPGPVLRAARPARHGKGPVRSSCCSRIRTNEPAKAGVSAHDACGESAPNEHKQAAIRCKS